MTYEDARKEAEMELQFCKDTQFNIVTLSRQCVETLLYGQYGLQKAYKVSPWGKSAVEIDREIMMKHTEIKDA